MSGVDGGDGRDDEEDMKWFSKNGGTAEEEGSYGEVAMQAE